MLAQAFKASESCRVQNLLFGSSGHTERFSRQMKGFRDCSRVSTSSKQIFLVFINDPVSIVGSSSALSPTPERVFKQILVEGGLHLNLCAFLLSSDNNGNVNGPSAWTIL